MNAVNKCPLAEGRKSEIVRNPDGFWRCKGCGQRAAHWYAVRHSSECSVAARMNAAKTDEAALLIAGSAFKHIAPKGRETLS